MEEVIRVRNHLEVGVVAATHDGFEVREEFEQSRFCATCHQFFDDAGVNGKPLENTYREWQTAGHGPDGRTYPWGIRFHPAWTCSCYSLPTANVEPRASGIASSSNLNQSR